MDDIDQALLAGRPLIRAITQRTHQRKNRGTKMSDLARYDGGGRGSVARRPSRSMRRTQERGELDLMQLANSGRMAEARGLVRRRLAEEGMVDVTEVGNLARELANGDAYIASLLIPIAQEFARTTARDIREFGRGF